MSSFMKSLNPELRAYLQLNELPGIYEALLCGLVVMCPDDCVQFLLDKLAEIKSVGIENLHWDMFIDDSKWPANKLISETSLDLIFYFDENVQPSPEMYAAAYGHYNNRLQNFCFTAWIQYYLRRKKIQERMMDKMFRAVRHHSHRELRLYLSCWRSWLKFRKGRQAMAFQKIQHIHSVSLGKIVFESWYAHTQEARNTREYFERLEHEEHAEVEVASTELEVVIEVRDAISNLPRKASLKIFSYVAITDLARCACVCRSWKVLTQASLLWSRLDLSKVRHLDKSITDRVAVSLLSKCRPYLMHLNLRGCQEVTKATFMSISDCRNLQDINLSECKGLNDETLRLMALGCKILLFLNVSHTDLTDASLRIIGKNFPNLHFLSLAYCTKFTDKGLQYLASGKNARKLEYIDLTACMQITPDGFFYIGSGCTNLKTLIINEFTSLNDSSIMKFAEICRRITTLSLLGSPLITDGFFKRLAENAHLETIKLDGNHRISDLSLKQMGRFCEGLTHVYLSDCQRLTDLSLKALAPCKNLRVLNVADCVRISDTGVRYLAEGACGPSLRELNLTNCVRVGDMAMVNIHKRCVNMAYLSLCFCENTSEAGIELLGQISTLISLDISGCNCGDSGLEALGSGDHIRDLIVNECFMISDLGVQKFAQQCKSIERLDFSHCTLLTDSSIKNLAFCCRLLNVLNITGCRQLTDISVQYLSGVCHYLRELDISECVLITDKALKYLRRGCSQLQVLTMLCCQGISRSAATKMLKYINVVKYSEEGISGQFSY